MHAHQFFLRCLLAVTLCGSVTVIGRADEVSRNNGNAAAGNSATASDDVSAKRWYTNLDEAQRAAHDSGRPIMIVFR